MAFFDPFMVLLYKQLILLSLRWMIILFCPQSRFLGFVIKMLFRSLFELEATSLLGMLPGGLDSGASSPLPSITSRGDSWISEWLSETQDQEVESSSAQPPQQGQNPSMEGTSVNQPEAERVPPANPVAAPEGAASPSRSTGTEGLPSSEGGSDRFPSLHAPLHEFRQNMKRAEQRLESLMAGNASLEDDSSFENLLRFLEETQVRWDRAFALYEAHVAAQREESARQDAFFEREIASMQSRIDALTEQNKQLKRRGIVFSSFFLPRSSLVNNQPHETLNSY